MGFGVAEVGGVRCPVAAEEATSTTSILIAVVATTTEGIVEARELVILRATMPCRLEGATVAPPQPVIAGETVGREVEVASEAVAAVVQAMVV